jgi:hypothetical protein
LKILNIIFIAVCVSNNLNGVSTHLFRSLAHSLTSLMNNDLVFGKYSQLISRKHTVDVSGPVRSCKIPSFSINRGTAPENLGEGNAASELKYCIF